MSRHPAGRPRSEHSTPQLSPIHSRFQMDLNPRTSPREGHMKPPVSLPSLRHLSRTPPTPSDKRYPDPFRGLLNPQAEIIEQQRERRRSESQLETPSPIDTQHSHSLPSISRPPSIESVQDDQSASRTFAQPSLPRHMISPKSGRIQKPIFGAATGTIDAHATPFIGAVPRPSESASSQNALPTPPPVNRVTYFPPTSTIIHQPPNSAFHESRRPSVGFPMSGSASPNAQYSPYSQPTSIESNQYENPNAPPQYVFGHHNSHPHDGRSSAGPIESDRSMIAMAPSPQSSIQLMTIKSQQGHNVQIPVDVQAASKVADEKRRRNAGASARFRARRKEKEREASQSISRLEQQLRDAIEDAQYYRLERDHFKSIVYQQPGAERHYARPPSPRLGRPSLPPRSLSSTRGGSVDSYNDYDDEDEPERNVRRRTDNYVSPGGPPQADVAANGPAPSPAYAQPFPGQMPNGKYPQQANYRDQAAPVDVQHPHSERPMYHEHFPAEHQNRSWTSNQGPHRAT